MGRAPAYFGLEVIMDLTQEDRETLLALLRFALPWLRETGDASSFVSFKDDSSHAEIMARLDDLRAKAER
jgi:hypothetical protein